MATDLGYIQFVCDQIHGGYDVRYRKMFGEYMVYLNDKPILLVCDNTVFVKKLAEISSIMQDADCKAPYDGAKEHYILDIENRGLTAKVLSILEEITPLPKIKNKKNK